MTQPGAKSDAQFEFQLAVERFETSKRNYKDYMRFIVAVGKCLIPESRYACNISEIEHAINDALQMVRKK